MMSLHGGTVFVKRGRSFTKTDLTVLYFLLLYGGNYEISVFAFTICPEKEQAFLCVIHWGPVVLCLRMNHVKCVREEEFMSICMN